MAAKSTTEVQQRRAGFGDSGEQCQKMTQSSMRSQFFKTRSILKISNGLKQALNGLSCLISGNKKISKFQTHVACLQKYY